MQWSNKDFDFFPADLNSLIMNQTKFHLVQNQKENYKHIPLNVKGKTNQRETLRESVALIGAKKKKIIIITSSINRLLLFFRESLFKKKKIQNTKTNKKKEKKKPASSFDQLLLFFREKLFNIAQKTSEHPPKWGVDVQLSERLAFHRHGGPIEGSLKPAVHHSPIVLRDFRGPPDTSNNIKYF